MFSLHAPLPRRCAIAALACALAGWGGALGADAIPVPNASFETQGNSYVNVNIDAWQKAPKPAWYVESGGFMWTQLTGAFKNPAPGSADRIDNCDGNQAIWLFAVPEVALFQDYDTVDFNDPAPTHAFNATFEVGKTYTLTVGVIGGGGGMSEGASLQISLYYRDGAGSKVTVGAGTFIHTVAAFPSTNHLVDCQVRVPVVKPGDAWAGQKIGVQFLSTVSAELQGGYWDLDNVRLSAAADPFLQAAPAGSQARISYLAAPGYQYQLESSNTLQAWAPQGTSVLGTGAETVALFPIVGSPVKFFRVTYAKTP